MELQEVLRELVWWAMAITAVKTWMGFDFPWHKCRCCGKKFSEHKWDSQKGHYTHDYNQSS